jgi:hypothetical protein
MTTIVNMFAGPGAGKSTTKAGLFFKMKLAGYRVEVVEEFAKELTYDGDLGTMENEMYMLAEQDRRQRRLLGKVDYVLTDAPLLKSAFYVRGVYDSPAYREHIERLFDSYDNVNVWVVRDKPYQTYGRTQTEDEAIAIDEKMRNALLSRMHFHVRGNSAAPDEILAFLENGG